MEALERLRLELVGIVEQLEDCDYKGETGELIHNESFVRLKELTDSHFLDYAIARSVLQTDHGLSCENWGLKPNGVYGGCGKCFPCQILERR